MKKGIRTDGVIRMIPGDRFTPFALARKLKARILFESSSFQRGKSRYSLLVLDEAFRLIQRGDRVLLSIDGEERPFSPAPARDILDAAKYFADQHPALHQDFPYPCGGFGYVGYEFASRCDAIRLTPKPDDIGVDDAVFLYGHVFLIYDHHADIIYLHGVNYHERQVNLEETLDAVEARIRDFDFNYLVDARASRRTRLVADAEGGRRFLDGVAALKRDIEDGGMIQAVLSRRLVVETDQDSFESYRRLRSLNPSPYMFHIDFGEFRLFGASPEMHVRVKEGRAYIRPLAGTRPRCGDAAVNAERERELLADEKELAEHMMLVDLARNDLGRIAKPGSVEMTKSLQVEHYSHVMHIASQVEAELAPGASPLDALRLSFPAGTVSGAPKIRAMETLDRLEIEPRRFYSGVVGYLEPGGDFDTCIAIRCGLQKGGRLYLRAGAGIVHDSRPEAELAETEHKLRAMLAALGLDENKAEAGEKETACLS